jgi:hypothetical protein
MNFYFRSVSYDDTFVSFATKEIIFLVIIVIILANMLDAADVNKLDLPLWAVWYSVVNFWSSAVHVGYKT